MSNDLSIAEFETIVTTRVLSRLLTDKDTKCVTESVRREELALKFSNAANGAMRELELSVDLRAIYRGGKTFIIYRPTGRIAAEISIDGLYHRGFVRRPKAILTSKRGFVTAKSLKELEIQTAKLGATRHTKGGKYGRSYQS